MLYQNYIRILYIDLNTKKVKFENREDLMHYIGGSGLSAKLFAEHVKYDRPPLDPEQPIVLAIGPMSTIFPVCTKVTASFFSPQTGEYGESHAGGRLAMTIRLVNVDAIVITGAASDPATITIKPNDIIFHDAEAIWMLPVSEAAQHMRNTSGTSGYRSILRIGPSGANLVPTACVNVDTYRHFGRLGLGACFGSKKLKGLIICGEKHFEIKKPNEYNKIYAEIYDKVTKTPLMEKYHELGTPKNVIPLNKINALPAYNLKKTNYEFAEAISGEAFAENVLFRKVSCAGCPIGCIHVGSMRRLFDKGYEYESAAVSYDHELVFSLGSELGIKTPNEVLTLIFECEEMCLDAISAGVILGFITEALEKGDITTADSIIDYKFGDTNAYVKGIRLIANPPNEFYKKVGAGLSTYTKSRKDKTYDYAIQMGGLEMAGYFTGPAHILGQLTGVRHSHVDNAGYSIDQKLKELVPKTIAQKVFDEELIRSVYTSLVICMFAREVYDLDTVCRALAVIDLPFTPDDLKTRGREILKIKFETRKKMGFDVDAHPLAKRFFEVQTPHGIIKEELMNEVIKEYKNIVDDFMKK
ncbi:MAG: aldehyde ferredoxin oxidoreductase N-terminal domain-containing protein [Candidatus Wallbacteria bacterium]